MGSLTFLLIISVVSYLIYFTYKEITRPLSFNDDDIKGLKMSIDLSNIKLDKNKKSMIKKILNDDRTYLIGVVILGIATLVICTLMIVGVL